MASAPDRPYPTGHLTAPADTAPASARSSSPTAWLVDAVARGEAGRALPPVVRDGPEGTIAVARRLSGAADARQVAGLLARPRFRPLAEALAALAVWCAGPAGESAAALAPGVLAASNTELFGPLVLEGLTACALRPADEARRLLALRKAQWQAALTLFLTRLHRDTSATCWPAEPRFRGAVTSLRAHGDETHNGGHRVLRVGFAGGGAVAYKPRPASGEVLFLAGGDAEASVFALLNSLPSASGEVWLPTLRCWRGTGADRDAYSWQEWVEPPPEPGVLRRSGRWKLTGTVLDSAAAPAFWHRAGSLAAAAAAFGMSDLIGENVLVGALPAHPGPALYPVDLEVFLTGLTGLYDTGLVHDPEAGGTHHVGLERTARWCAPDGPRLHWRERADGSLALERRSRPLARTATRSVVGDTRGRTGYGPYLPAMLRGMFDAWTLMCRSRERLAGFLAERLPDHRVRVVARDSAEYGLHPDELAGSPGFAPAEREQMARGDVPYFFRSAAGGELLAVRPPGDAPGTSFGPTGAGPCAQPWWPPAADVSAGARLTLAGLGPALRDAVRYVHGDCPHDVHDRAAGVRLRVRGPRHGQACFDWPQTGRRITFTWDAARIRLRVDALTDPWPPGPSEPAEEVRAWLLALERVDAPLRERWAATGMRDASLQRRLDRLTRAGMRRLRVAVAERGWPDIAAVGPRAAGAAARLLQHATGEPDFRKHCLELMRSAAREGGAPWDEVARLTDTLRLAEGLAQVYGTKFADVGGVLEPCAIEDADGVDERRAALGLEPLHAYTERVRRRFGMGPQPEEGGS
ncbi:DUF4135 domain-containing protein [Streptomyces sp. NPDC020983]|uniref:DUF4135 domain-containing protein n=1 Tax=Streptomyces sp. NPDC020983 TaxID=3365106 RepID=UPI0037BA558F